jgi:hypothetical protein
VIEQTPQMQKIDDSEDNSELSPELRRILEEEQEEADDKVILDMAREEFPTTTVEEIEQILSDPSKDPANKQSK